MVESFVANENVEGSNPFSRSNFEGRNSGCSEAMKACTPSLVLHGLTRGSGQFVLQQPDIERGMEIPPSTVPLLNTVKHRRSSSRPVKAGVRFKFQLTYHVYEE